MRCQVSNPFRSGGNNPRLSGRNLLILDFCEPSVDSLFLTAQSGCGGYRRGNREELAPRLVGLEVGNSLFGFPAGIGNCPLAAFVDTVEACDAARIVDRMLLTVYAGPLAIPSAESAAVAFRSINYGLQNRETRQES